MARLGRTLIKKVFFENIKPLLKKYGFKKGKIGRGGSLTSIEKTENEVLTYTMLGTHSLDEVNYGFVEIGYIRLDNIFAAALGINLGTDYLHSSFFRCCFDIQYPMVVHSESEIKLFSDKFCQDFVEHYLPAFEKYSDYKNVLEFWDSLISMGDKGIYFQDVHNYSKIIILSKMCNDENYQKRADETIAFFQSEIDKGEDWMQTKLDVFMKVVKYLAENNI
jgi:hypothetical protein